VIYKFESAAYDAEFIPIDVPEDATMPTDEGLRQEWELNYVSAIRRAEREEQEEKEEKEWRAKKVT
jgi:hypothetical protein